MVVRVDEISLSEGELAEVIMRSSSSQTLLRLRRVRDAISSLQREEQELMEALRRERAYIESLAASNALQRKIQDTLVYNALGARTLLR